MNETLIAHIKNRATGYEILFGEKPTTGNIYPTRHEALKHLQIFLEDDEFNNEESAEDRIIIIID